jgi:hypothetical protein
MRPGPGSMRRRRKRPRTLPSPVPRQTGHVNVPAPSHSGQTTPWYFWFTSFLASALQNPVPEHKSHGTFPEPVQFLQTELFASGFDPAPVAVAGPTSDETSGVESARAVGHAKNALARAANPTWTNARRDLRPVPMQDWHSREHLRVSDAGRWSLVVIT